MKIQQDFPFKSKIIWEPKERYGSVKGKTFYGHISGYDYDEESQREYLLIRFEGKKKHQRFYPEQLGNRVRVIE